MSISITPAAAAHIQKCLDQRGSGLGLRINIKPSGCSGYSYALDFADSINDDDAVFTDNNAQVLVAQEHLQLLEGTEVDYVTEGANSFFRFNNPLVKDACGCGESFSV